MDCLNLNPFCYENQAQDAPKAPQDAPRRPKTAQDGPKTAPRGPKIGPKRAQNRPKMAQEGAKTTKARYPSALPNPLRPFFVNGPANLLVLGL